MSEDLTLEQITLLISLANIGEENRGYIKSTSDIHINKLFSLGFVRKETHSKLKEGEDFYMISEKGRGLAYAIVDHSNDLLHYWEKRSQKKNSIVERERVKA